MHRHQARFRELTELYSDWYWEQDAKFRFTRIESYHAIDADLLSEASCLGKRLWEIGLEAEGGWDAYRELLGHHRPFRDIVVFGVHGDGMRQYIGLSGEPMFDDRNRFIGYRGVGRDISERKRDELATQRLSRMYAALSATNEAILRAKSPEELYQRVCDAAVHGSKFANTTVFIAEAGTHWVKMVASTGPGGQAIRGVRISVDPALPEGRGLVGNAFRSQQGQIANDFVTDPRLRPWHEPARKAGWAAAAALPLIRGGRSVGVLTFYSTEKGAFDDEMARLLDRMAENVSFALDNLERDAERKRIEERIQYLATHDALTGLPNRVLFNQLLGQAIRSAQRHKSRFAVLFVDLDGFKAINDTFGHEAGDKLLQETAARLNNALRISDVVARLGGDEFVVLMDDVTDVAQIETVARKIIAALGEPIASLGRPCVVTASIGIASYPQDGVNEQALMKNADSAMYLAKEKGKNNFQFYVR